MRKPISKKIRFEIFKRDKFTCQYCGQSAPSVILEIDHINPVAKGGDNSIFNLVTSCYDCNHGKSDRTLSDDSHAKKMKNGLDENQEKINQIDMLFKWKSTMIKADDYEIEKFVNYFMNSINADISRWDHYLKPVLKKVIVTLLKEYDHELILNVIDISIHRYIHSFTNISMRDVDNAISKLKGIAKNTLLENNNIHHKEMTIALNNMRKEFGYCFDWYKMYTYIEEMIGGFDDDEVTNILQPDYYQEWIDQYSQYILKGKLR